jgi:hypothetical protein
MISTKHMIRRVLLADVIAIRIAVAVGAILFGVGMLTGDIADDAYNNMKTLMPAWAWALSLFAYAAAKFYLAAQWPENVHISVAVVVALVGLFLWTFTYVSFVADGRSAAETIMLAIIGCEIWISAHTLAGTKRV